MRTKPEGLSARPSGFACWKSGAAFGWSSEHSVQAQGRRWSSLSASSCSCRGRYSKSHSAIFSAMMLKASSLSAAREGQLIVGPIASDCQTGSLVDVSVLATARRSCRRRVQMLSPSTPAEKAMAA